MSQLPNPEPDSGLVHSLRSRSGSTYLRRPGIVIAMVGLVVVAGLIALFLLMSRGASPVDATKIFIDKVVARDASAAALLTDPASLQGTARGLGLELLPASVSVTMTNPQLREVGGSTSEASSVMGRWTLVATDRSGPGTPIDQTATFDLSKAADGRWLIDTVASTGPLEFDLSTYFGSTGTNAQVRDSALADLQAGSAWLPGMTITGTDSKAPVQADPIVTDDPNAFVGDDKTTTAAVVGEVTHWSIAVSDEQSSGAFEIASAKTTQEMPAQVTRGTLTNEAVLASATSWVNDWVSRVHSGDPAAAGQVTKAGIVSPAAWLRMQTSGLTLDANATAEMDTTDGITVRYGGLAVARQATGTWLVDPELSGLITDWLPGSGAFSTKQYAALVDFTDCLGTKTGATLRITLDGIGFRGGDAAPVATFRVVATGDLKCADGLALDVITATWPGQSNPVSLYSSATTSGDPTSFIDVALPAHITIKDQPISLHVKVNRIETFDWLRDSGGQGTFVARPA